MTVTLTFRVDEDKKIELEKWFNELKTNLGCNKGPALIHVVEQYKKGFTKAGVEPPSVENLLNEIGCIHLKFEDLEYKCFERFEKRKKPDPLGTDTDKIRTRCEACKLGKAEAIMKQYQTKLRGQNIKGILSMIKQFQTFAQSGVPSTISFCTRIPTRQVITGKKTIHCGKVGMQIVPIDPTCKDPKCQYFKEFTIKVEHEFPKEALTLIEGIAEDYARIEDLSPGKPKEVEADQEHKKKEKKKKDV